jgi:hypothetical protein
VMGKADQSTAALLVIGCVCAWPVRGVFAWLFSRITRSLKV